VNNTLLNLDFRPGIRDEDINYNFDLIKDWIDRERLRVGGWGIVEGFEFTKDLPNFAVNISKGTLINEQGEEVIVDPYREIVGPPVYQKYQETVTVASDGTITLKFPVYSEQLHADVYYIPPEHISAPVDAEFSITTEENTKLQFLNIYKNHIIVNTEHAGKTVTVDYLYANDRIDAVFLKKDGSDYLYQKGIISTNPSSPDLSKYTSEYYLIGFCLWHVDTTVDVEFITYGRSFRKVFVDRNNILWLNGKKYIESKFIYFIEPESPEENDLWLDDKTNILYVWKKKNGIYGWQAVNDQSDVPIRSTYLFSIENNPEDMQTFLFPTENTDLIFIPGMRSLDICIDNTPLMIDQFSEVVEKGLHDYEDRGIGFKLIEPLDEKTPVQVTVTHAVRSMPEQETFQRMAIFTEENFQPYNENTGKVFFTELPYEAGEQQLEVWLDGKRLTRNIDFKETIETGLDVTDTDKGKMTTSFRLLCPLTSGQRVTHKVTRHMWSYENLQKVVDTIEKNTDTALTNSIATQKELTTLSDNVSKNISEINTKISSTVMPDLTIYQKKTDVITKSQLTEIKKNLFTNTFYLLTAANSVTTLSNISDTDYIKS
jgi:hypothetical protein